MKHSKQAKETNNWVKSDSKKQTLVRRKHSVPSIPIMVGSSWAVVHRNLQKKMKRTFKIFVNACDVLPLNARTCGMDSEDV
jgi:hypothetical protein